MRVLSIDPGNKESGWCILHDYKPVAFGKTENEELLKELVWSFPLFDKAVIEMIRSYGMAVGETVFETCVWIGRFEQLLRSSGISTEYVYRKEYVTELCGSSKAKDSNVIQYLIDRFAKDTPNRGKGTKKEPGWFYGVSKDVWQAIAIGVYYTDKNG